MPSQLPRLQLTRSRSWLGTRLHRRRGDRRRRRCLRVPGDALRMILNQKSITNNLVAALPRKGRRSCSGEPLLWQWSMVKFKVELWTTRGCNRWLCRSANSPGVRWCARFRPRWPEMSSRSWIPATNCKRERSNSLDSEHLGLITSVWVLLGALGSSRITPWSPGWLQSMTRIHHQS
jgi:hypothetical protein